MLTAASDRFERRLAEEMSLVRSEIASVRLEVASVRLDIAAEIASTRWTILRWVIGISLAQTGLILSRL